MGSTPNRPPWDTMVATLRMLLAVAWADGRVEDAEKRALLRIAQELGLDPERAALFREDIEADTPVLWADVVRRPLRRADIDELLELARAIAAADGHLDPREQAALQGLMRLLTPQRRA